jgi:NAD(P)-dependent dehydrogenase (short-subunit alcohol dehydrogenase family)
MKPLEGQVAVVTGAGRGIGRGIAEELLTAGAKVVISQRNESELQVVAKELGELGEVSAFACDVSLRHEAQALCDHAVAEFGKLDLLVANAGTSSYSPFLEMKEEDWDRVLGVNLKGCYLTGQAAAQRMAAAGNGGTIVLISSICASAAEPNSAPYTASKGGVSALAKAMAVDLAPHRITVNAIAPGWIHSTSTSAITPEPLLTGEQPFPLNPLEVIGQPKQIGSTVVWLASPGGSFTTGSVITVDGGQTAVLQTVNQRALGKL